MNIKLKIFVLLLAALLLAGQGAFVSAQEEGPPNRLTLEQPEIWMTTTAYGLGVVFWNPWYEPHYGAAFNGSNGHSQHYLGPGGDSATCGSSAGCISNWNWWGSSLNVLLVPKSGWLWNSPCCTPEWDHNNYQATLWVD